jgi:hypothetical protein
MSKNKERWEELHREEYIENCAREMSLAHPPPEHKCKEEEKESTNNKNPEENEDEG